VKRLNHVRKVGAANMLCGRPSNGEPEKGRPVCPECVDALMVLASRSTGTYVWRSDDNPRPHAAFAS
jgi:hypothetical protein